MKTTTVNMSEIAQNPIMRIDAEYWEKKKNLQIGTKVIIAHNLEGNMEEPFIGLHGIVIRFKNKDWYQVVLEQDTIYGKKFNFHIDEIEIL